MSRITEEKRNIGNSKTSQKKKDKKNGVFVNYNPTQIEREVIKANGLMATEFLESLERFLSQGFRLTLKWDAYTDAYSANLLDGTLEFGTATVLNTRASTAERALACMHYAITGPYSEPEDWAEQAKPQMPDL